MRHISALYKFECNRLALLSKTQFEEMKEHNSYKGKFICLRIPTSLIDNERDTIADIQIETEEYEYTQWLLRKAYLLSKYLQSGHIYNNKNQEMTIMIPTECFPIAIRVYNGVGDYIYVIVPPDEDVRSEESKC